MTAVPEVGRSKYISTADTAKLVRKALAKAFPDYKFTVRSNSYAGGASIDVGWYDGPPAAVVDSVVGCYAGGRFDGMIDMKYGVEHWINPDGTAYIAENPGTAGQRGMDPGCIGDPEHPDAQLVHFAADFVFTNRRLTDEAKTLIKRKAFERYGNGSWYGDADEQQKQRVEHGVEQRWLFPPCEYTFSVTRPTKDGYVTEATGFTSKTAAQKKARELEKARAPRGFRYLEVHRKGVS